MKKVFFFFFSALLAAGASFAQTGNTPATAPAPVTLSGTVTDSATRQPLAGVSVFLNSTSIGTTTQADGTFVLKIPLGKYQLVISAIGYETRITEITGNQP